MSKNEFIKIGYTNISVVNPVSSNDFQKNHASQEIVERLEKFANTVRAVAPRSDDFLYFTIIFLKAAEAALIDEFGNTKKIGNEKAWGYFDQDWRWHGNVKPHRNNNSDIFPEIELKKAARNWIGRPLCVDHKSDSVDGIRGIILDTYYDEKLKQVVGLCALDKINYPDLSRKVTTGVVRYGSMGTAVTTSICSDCGKPAASPKDYCEHIMKRQAWGEINIGLNPIEYSLVVQPAEPGAILLRCIASIKNHTTELNSYGIDVDNVIDTLDEKNAGDLDLLLNKVCDNDSCSIEQRQRIIKGYFKTNGFTKSAKIEEPVYNKELLTDLARFEDVFGKYSENPELYQKFFGKALEDLDVTDVNKDNQVGQEEQLTSHQNAYNSETLVNKDDSDVSDFSGVGSSGLVSGVSDPNPDSFKGTGVGPETYAFSSKEEEHKNIKISSIMEEIMNESRLRKRAALRRKLAYPQGGADPEVEPSTFKSDGEHQNKVREQDDKQMNLKPTNLGGTEGMVPGDKEIKEKVLRAKDQRQSKKAYFQGATDSVEPSTFSSEEYKKYWDLDKQMHQTGNMGGESGMFPGDEKTKEQLKRAAYKGPTLSTKFKQRRTMDGKINKSASCFEVYSGGKLVIATTAKDIFGSKVEENWDWITSKEYGKAVVAEIRTKGLNYVGNLLTKKAQQAQEPVAGVVPELDTQPVELGDVSELPDFSSAEEAPVDEPESTSPKSEIEDSLVSMEDTIEQIRKALSDLSGSDDVDVNINVGEKSVEMPEDKLALSRDLYHQLKVVLGEAQESADELALISEAYDKFGKFHSSQKRDIRVLANDALQDFASITGQSKALISMAKAVSKSLVKTSEYVEVVEPVVSKNKSKESVSSKDTDNELVVRAMEYRKQKRQDILKKAQEMEKEVSEKEVSLADDKEDMEACADDKLTSDDEKAKKENDAHDGIGLPENAPVSGVTKDLAADVAVKKPVGGEHKPSPSVGNQDAKQFDKYPNTNSRQVAEKSVTSVKSNSADDGSEKKDDVKKETEEQSTPVKEKMSTAFMKKKEEEERESYRLKLRRAYDIAMEMQRKGMLPPTRPALDRQVDNMMDFDDRAFESFKRSVAEAQGNKTMKIASDLDGITVGITEESETSTKSGKLDAESLASLWE